MNKKGSIVIVLYKTTVKDSVSYKSLIESIDLWNDYFELVVYNNSPENTILEEGSDYTSLSARENGFLATAYNEVLAYSEKKNYQWLLLLDQDTNITNNYIEKVLSFVSCPNSSSYAAAFPKLYYKNIQISPRYYYKNTGVFYNISNVSASGNVPLEKSQYISVFNSASVLNIQALKSIGGFPLDYPLDLLDVVYYKRLLDKGYPFWMLDVSLSQGSSYHENQGLTISRHVDFLKKNRTFAKELKGTSIIFFYLRLLSIIRQGIFHSNKRKYVLPTIKVLFNI